jgi:hypothetical protein
MNAMNTAAPTNTRIAIPRRAAWRLRFLEIARQIEARQASAKAARAAPAHPRATARTAR